MPRSRSSASSTVRRENDPWNPVEAACSSSKRLRLDPRLTRLAPCRRPFESKPPRCVFVQIRVPGGNHRNAQPMAEIGAELADVARAGEVQHVRRKPPQRSLPRASCSATSPDQTADRARGRTNSSARPFEIESHDRAVVHQPRFRSCMHRQQRDVAAFRARLDRHASCGPRRSLRDRSLRRARFSAFSCVPTNMGCGSRPGYTARVRSVKNEGTQVNEKGRDALRPISEAVRSSA